MDYEKHHDLLVDRTVWTLRLVNRFSQKRALLLSKVSEAVLPCTPGNHVGPGATLDDFLSVQQGVQFIINGGFNHYRKNFYAWPHQDFQVGDPVGLVKIRDHYYDDVIDAGLFGYFVQERKGDPWSIVEADALNKSAKYILGCTPLLITNSAATALPPDVMAPMPAGVVNPPSVLGHGLQRHPRTAVGVRGDELVFVVVEGGSSGGCTLPELQQIGLALKLSSMLNLDGGGSTQFRLRTANGWVSNFVDAEDEGRVLGNVVVLFDDAVTPTAKH